MGGFRFLLFILGFGGAGAGVWLGWARLGCWAGAGLGGLGLGFGSGVLTVGWAGLGWAGLGWVELLISCFVWIEPIG